MKVRTIIARVILGIVFIFSGVVKAIDPLGTVYKIEDYLRAFGGFCINLLPLAWIAAGILITTELVLGIAVCTNVWPKVIAWITTAFYAVMTPLTLYIAIANPVSDCGCFGDAIVISNTATFWKNVFLLCLTIFWTIANKLYPPTNRDWRVNTTIVAGTAVVAILFMVWTTYHLPIIDFRPYKIGNNIPELMEYPEGAPADVYEVKLVYKNQQGEEKVFELTNYPKDSTWTFVEQKSKLIKKGYEPPIHDFEIRTENFDDITDNVLTSEIPVHLVIMYDLKKSNQDLYPKIRTLFESSLQKHEPVFILTGSGEEEVELLKSQLELAIPICSCDPVTLKTIVRANPGVITIKNGTIIDKYNLRNK